MNEQKSYQADGDSTGEDTVAELVQMFEASEEATYNARVNAEKDRDYYDGNQWTEKERATIESRGQPVLTFNRVKTKVNFLLGYESQSRSDPKAFPRTPQDEETAEAATDALKFVDDAERMDVKFSDVFENMLVEGFGGVEILIKQNRQGRKELDIKRWKWDRLFFDPHSSESDFSDAQYLGGVIWMDYEKAKRKYPDNVDALDVTLSEAGDAGTSETFDDKPKHVTWAEKTGRKRIRIVQIYYRREGKWWWCHYTKGGKLAGGVPVEFLDSEGDSECPLILASAYVDRDNNRYGEVRALRDPQDEYNKRRSKLLHMGMQRQVRADKGATPDVRKAKAELAKPDGYIETNPGKTWEILNNNDQIAVQAQLLQNAEAEIDVMGPNSAMQGKDENAASGRAIIANQQGGVVELAKFMDRYRDFKLRVYRQIWNRIRQFWDEERWIRVTDDEKNVKFVGLNRALSVGDMAIKNAESQGMKGQQLNQLKQMAAQDPRAQAPSGQTENVLAEMDMDIIIEDAPDTVSIQQEQFEQLTQLASAGVVFPPEFYIQASQLRNKEKLIESLKGGGEDAEPSPEEQAALQEANELKRRAVEAEIRVDETTADKNKAAALKLVAETENAIMQPDPLPGQPQQPQA